MKLLTDIQIGPLQGIGPLANPGSNAGSLFESTLSKVIGVMTVVAFIWFTFMVILGAIRMVGSGGDKAGVEGARKQITTGVIGIVIVIAAIFIVKLIGALFGLNHILNPTCIISNSC